MYLSKEFRFEASHQLYNHSGKCAQLHGHSWKLTVSVSGLVRKDTGMVLDFFDLKEAVQPIVDRLDHTHLGSGKVNTHGDYTWLEPSHEPSLPELPTSENLLLWIAEQLPEGLPWVQLQLNETCTSQAILNREDWEQNYAVHQKAKGPQGEETTAGTQDAKSAQVTAAEFVPRSDLD